MNTSSYILQGAKQTNKNGGHYIYFFTLSSLYNLSINLLLYINGLIA